MGVVVPRIGFLRGCSALTVLAAALILATGCYKGLNDVVTLYEQGQWEAAAALAANPKEVRKLERDLVLWHLEEGKILQDLNRFEASNAAFERAEALIRAYDLKPEVSITEETGAVVTDQTQRNYRGTMADKTLLHCYMAINWLALGNVEEANVQGQKVTLRLAEAEQYFSAQIAGAERAAQKYQLDLSGLVNRPEFAAGDGPMTSPALADFQNPFALYMSALCLAAAGRFDDARVDMAKVAAMAPDNPWLAEEVELLERAASGWPYPPRVFVVLEGGLGPRLQPVVIPFVTPWTGYSQYQFPRLVFEPRRVGGLFVSDGSGAPLGQTRFVASLDGVVAADFQKRLPGIVTRTIVSAIVKETVTYAATQQAWQQYGTEGAMFALLAASAYKTYFSRADLRTWRTIGKEVQAIHLPRPPDGRLQLTLLDGSGRSTAGALATLDLPNDPLVFVFVRATNAWKASWMMVGIGSPQHDRTGRQLTAR
ncbi:MAG: hypothetical protein Kow0059_15650 [Candidatus Sumerlaeia bacterium]